MHAKVQHAERAARVHEAAAEKLRARLAAQVTAEERRCKRNAEAYARAKRTVAVNRGRFCLVSGCMFSFISSHDPCSIPALATGMMG